MFDTVVNILSNFRIADAIDITIVSYILYKVLGYIRKTRAQQLVRGLVILAVIFFLSDIFNLYLLNWLLKSIVTIGIFAIIVLFQPELRRGLEQLGRRSFVRDSFTNIDKDHAIEIVDNIVTAVDDFSNARIGALIIIERDTQLNDIIETGTVVDAEISVRLLGNLFYEGSPLHDGAVIIRADRIHAASCVLPLTSSNDLGRNLGTRHRAGVGISEVSDALVIIVSEETGVISVAENGSMKRFLDQKYIEKLLLNVYLPQESDMHGRMTNLLSKVKKVGGKLHE